MLVFTLILDSQKYCVHQFFLYLDTLYVALEECIIAFLDFSFSHAYFATVVRLIYLVPLGGRADVLLLLEFLRTIFFKMNFFVLMLGIYGPAMLIETGKGSGEWHMDQQNR